MKQNSILALKKSVSFTEIDGSVVAVDTKKQEGYVFSGTGALIWKAIDGNRTIDDLVGITINEFDVDKTTAEKDISEFIEGLKRKGLVKIQ